MSGKNVKRVNGKGSLASRVIALIETARQRVATVANVVQVYTNYEIGRQIVEEEQGGKRRAEYGKKILIDLSQKLTARFGRGWSVDNLEKMRRFFLLYSQVEISATPLRKFGGNEKSAKGLRKSDEAESSSTICQVPRFTLGWSHYLLLMRIADPVKRAFYEREATERIWTFTQLERMYRASTFERLQIAKDKDKVRALMTRPAPDVEVAGEALSGIAMKNGGAYRLSAYSRTQVATRIFEHYELTPMRSGMVVHCVYYTIFLLRMAV